MKYAPIISNQHGALVMAFVPFLYGISESHFVLNHLWLGLSWLFLYLFSYPFFAIFSKKSNVRQKKWATIYFSISLFLALPLLFSHFAVLQFSVPILPLAVVQIYYAKQKNERHLLNDMAGILTFGVVGMASFYLATGEYRGEILLHPSLFFLATTLYIKSVARERNNPRYRQASLLVHSLFGIVYWLYGNNAIALAYLIGLARAFWIPSLHLNIKQVGMLEFVVIIFFISALLV